MKGSSRAGSPRDEGRQPHFPPASVLLMVLSMLAVGAASVALFGVAIAGRRIGESRDLPRGAPPLVLAGYMDKPWSLAGPFRSWRNPTAERLPLPPAQDGKSSASQANRPAMMMRLLQLLAKASQANVHGGYAMVQLLNDGFIDFARHWVCNVAGMEHVLQSTVFIATDPQSLNAMRANEHNLNVFYWPFHHPFSSLPQNASKLSYGELSYYRYMDFRTELLYRILDNNVSFLLVESDAYWTRNVLKEIEDLRKGEESLYNADLISASDRWETDELQGGFQLSRPTDNSKRMWMNLHVVMHDRLMWYEEQQGARFVLKHSQQVTMARNVNRAIRRYGFRLAYLPRRIVACGQWYSNQTFREEIPQPAVILNNWLIGSAAKKERAKAEGHWAIDESGQCISAS